MLARFLRDVTATFLSVTDTYIRTYTHHENRFWIRKLATLAINNNNSSNNSSNNSNNNSNNNSSNNSNNEKH